LLTEFQGREIEAAEVLMQLKAGPAVSTPIFEMHRKLAAAQQNKAKEQSSAAAGVNSGNGGVHPNNQPTSQATSVIQEPSRSNNISVIVAAPSSWTNKTSRSLSHTVSGSSGSSSSSSNSASAHVPFYQNHQTVVDATQQQQQHHDQGSVIHPSRFVQNDQPQLRKQLVTSTNDERYVQVPKSSPAISIQRIFEGCGNVSETRSPPGVVPISV
jgi:hypothetical protein